MIMDEGLLMIWRRRRLGRPYDKQSQFRHRVDGGHGPPYEAAVAAAATNKANRRALPLGKAGPGAPNKANVKMGNSEALSARYRIPS